MDNKEVIISILKDMRPDIESFEGLKLVDNDLKIDFLEKKIDDIRRELEN